MPFAAVTYVRLEGRDPAELQRLLSEVMVPRLKAMPGFRAARFLRSQDGATGVGAVVFDTESNAKAGLEVMTAQRPAEAPAIESSAIHEVVLDVPPRREAFDREQVRRLLEELVDTEDRLDGLRNRLRALAEG